MTDAKNSSRRRTGRRVLDRLIGDDRGLRAQVDEQLFDVRLGEALYEARVAAGLTQAALAKLAKTSPSVVARLEDADGGELSVSVLKRIAAALRRRLEVRFLPEPAERRPVSRPFSELVAKLPVHVRTRIARRTRELVAEEVSQHSRTSVATAVRRGPKRR